jgi:glycine/D-amino acid oxidase-like deaminating enzyme
MKARVTIVGGGIGGLIAALACAERGHGVELHEANQELGGRGRSSEPPYVANLGPHALYADGAMWPWLKQRDLVPPTVRPSFSGFRIVSQGRLRRGCPPLVWAALRLPRRAPVDRDYRSWAAELAGERAAEAAIGLLSLPTFDHDPGRLSAAFAQERLRRVTYRALSVRYVKGGWVNLIERLADRARRSGVRIHTGSRIEQLPAPPAIVATSPRAAGRLLGLDLSPRGTRTALLDVGLRAEHRWPASVLDVDGRIYAARVSSVDDGVAPPGHQLIQASAGIRPSESIDAATARIEALLDLGFTGWREAESWRRKTVVEQSSGALDSVGCSWHDRPHVDRGDGVFLVGDFLAAPGMLSEVAFGSALEAADRIDDPSDRTGRTPQRWRSPRRAATGS